MVSCTDANAETVIAAYLLDHDITGNITITAQWQLKKYAVWFDAGEDGYFVVDENKPEGVTFYNDKNATAEVENGKARYAVIIVEHNGWPDLPITPQTPGSSFSSWDFGGENKITSERSPANGNAITAYWTTENYSIRYELDGGEPLSGNYETSYQYGEVIDFTVSPYVPTREGYSFLGWFDQEGEDGNEIKSTEGKTGDLTLYAHWKVNTYALQLTISLPQGAEKETIEGWFSAVKDEGIFSIAKDIVDNSITVWVYAEYGTSLTALNSVLKTIGNNVPKGWEYEGSAYYFSTMPESGTPLEFGEDNAPVNIEESGGMQLTNSYASQENYHTITVYLTPDKKTVYTILYVLSENNTVAPADPTRTGYTFSRWMQDNADSEDTVFTFGNPLDENIVIYAEWTPNKYTVTFNGNGATSGSMDVQKFKYDEAQALNENTFSRTGYTFIGWATTPDGNVKDPYKDQETVSNLTADENGEVTLYAVWEANTYKIEFHYGDTSASADNLADYGGELSASDTFAYGANISFADAAIPHYSHVWYRWMSEHDAVLFSNSTMPDLSDERYTDYVDKEGSTYTIYLYAVYTAETYYIRYQSGEPTPVNVTMETETKLKAAEPSLGYAFVGWELYTNGNSVSGENYFNFFAVGEDEEGNKVVVFRTQSGGGNTYSVPLGGLESYTLVPHFEAIEYMIEFVGGDGATGSTASMSLSYGETDTLTKNEFKKSGYNFAGWALSGSDSVAYADGARITITSDLVEGLGEGKTITLTAKWTPIVYTITYVLNGGSLSGNPDLTYTIEESVTLALPADRTGYKFCGWFEKEDFSGDAVSEIAKGSTGNKVFYAKWEPESYTVTFNPNGGSAVAEQSVVYNGTATMPEQPVREGYVFEGWFSGETQFDFAAAITGDVTLTAKWSPRGYSISYVLGGGTNAAGNPSGYTVESDTITLGAPTREGYTFAGWYDAEENGNLVTQIAAGSKGNITLYAAWQANSFEVDFVANGGTLDGADTQKVTAGGTVAYAEPVRENYLFVGWFTDEALTVRYDFKTPVTGNLTLYAKWRLQVVTGVTENGTVVTVSSDAGFDDGTQLHFVEVTDEDTVGSAAAHLRDNMTLARLFDIEIVDAGGAPVEITEPLSVGIFVEGLSEAEGNWGVVYVPDGEGEIEVLATHVGDDGRLYFFVEHFSFYAVVDIAEIGAGFAWWWILVAVAGCALIALILVLVARSAHRYELNFVNGGVPAQKLKESALIDLPLPEREEEAFEGWYFDEDFRDRATLTSMPKQNLILFAKWRKLTDEERAARDRARAEAAAMAEEGFHHAAPRQEKKHKENPLSEIKEDD